MHLWGEEMGDVGWGVGMWGGDVGQGCGAGMGMWGKDVGPGIGM